MWDADSGQQTKRTTRGRRPLIVALVVCGAILQHFIVAPPPGAVPARAPSRDANRQPAMPEPSSASAPPRTLATP